MLENYDSSVQEELVANGLNLEEKLRDLKSLDAEIIDCMQEDDIEKDVLQSSEFAAKHRVLLTKIKMITSASPSGREHAGVSEQNVKHKVVKLPYLQLVFSIPFEDLVGTRQNGAHFGTLLLLQLTEIMI